MKTTSEKTSTRASTLLLIAVSLVGVMLICAPTWGVNPAAPRSLKTIPVPEPNNLGLFLRSNPANLNADGFPISTSEAKNAAIALGKALFWDMQLGSDGVMACATCHFHAGADSRTKNTINPGVDAHTEVGDRSYQLIGPNGTLTPEMFPFTKFLDPVDRFSEVLFDTNDSVGSQGVRNTAFTGLPKKKGAVEQGTVVPSDVFQVGGINTRRVTRRNAPTMINAVYNFANFWDGKANNIFNGVNSFGDSDPNAGIWVNDPIAGLQKERVRIPYASLASQATGPPLSSDEMSFAGRTFPDIGRKLLNPKLRPLAQQKVDPNDSVLGPYTQPRPGFSKPARTGLNTSYAALILAAFQDKYRNSTELVNGYTQMETNFSLFFGLAVQLYEATLVSDDSPFDRFQEGDDTAMSASAQMGLNIFLTLNEPGQVGGSCIDCHGTSAFTNASVMHLGPKLGESLPEVLIERMIMGDSGGAWYDNGTYNIGVRPTEEDLGRGDTDPFGFPLSFTERAVLVANGTPLPFETPPLPCGPGYRQECPQDQRMATKGAFKTPALRNIELTGPYMHNGGQATLMQVMDFYSRGGDFHERNIETLDPEITVLFGLIGNDDNEKKVIDFMLALTDERVRWERAPFDHPELFVPEGAPGDALQLQKCKKNKCDTLLYVPAVGADGRSAEMGPVGTFLGLDPYQP